MCNFNAKLFYGTRIDAESLIIAADIFSKCKGALLALDMIRNRKMAGQLRVSNKKKKRKDIKTSIVDLPVEILCAIKGSVLDIAYDTQNCPCWIYYGIAGQMEAHMEEMYDEMDSEMDSDADSDIERYWIGSSVERTPIPKIFKPCKTIFVDETGDIDEVFYALRKVEEFKEDTKKWPSERKAMYESIFDLLHFYSLEMSSSDYGYPSEVYLGPIGQKSYLASGKGHKEYGWATSTTAIDLTRINNLNNENNKIKLRKLVKDLRLLAHNEHIYDRAKRVTDLASDAQVLLMAGLCQCY